MNNHTDVYINLMNQVDICQDKSNELSDRALHLRARCRIDEDEYYQMMSESDVWQKRYVYLRDKAITADRIYFLEHAEDIQRQHEWTEQMRDERPV